MIEIQMSKNLFLILKIRFLNLFRASGFEFKNFTIGNYREN